MIPTLPESVAALPGTNVGRIAGFKKLRILKVISSLNYGGAETQLIRSAKELVREGHQVCVCTIANKSEREEELIGSGVELVVYNKKRKIDLGVIRRLRKTVKSFRPDIVHAYLFDAEFYSRIALLGLNVSLINSERSDGYLLNTSQKLANFISERRINGIIANSHSGKRHAASIYPKLNENDIHVVWNSIDAPLIQTKVNGSVTDYKTQFFGDPGVKVAVMVAAIKEAKNYEFALRVANALVQKDSNWRVIFIGDKVPNESDAYSKEIRRLYSVECDQQKIVFLGNRNDVVEILAASDASFLTSRYEGFPNVVLESMAVGTPVVTTLFSDIEQIQPFDWMIIRNENHELFAQTIIRVSENSAELSLLSKEWVNSNCSTETITEQLLSVYRKYV